MHSTRLAGCNSVPCNNFGEEGKLNIIAHYVQNNMNESHAHLGSMKKYINIECALTVCRRSTFRSLVFMLFPDIYKFCWFEQKLGFPLIVGCTEVGCLRSLMISHVFFY